MKSAPNKNNFINYRKVISIANADWQNAEELRISGLNVKVSGTNYLTDQYARNFHHFCTTSYLNN